MIEHVESKTLFLGDNSFAHRMGRFDNSASMLGNIKALQYATGLKLNTYVPGHGKSGTSDAAVKPFLDYLIQIQSVVKAGMDDDLEDFEIKEKVIGQFSAYESWEGFDSNFGRHINSMYLEIEKTAW
jgi:glyoxylase-like metal-dependent hydrolase (beta-lactamase superfamily II)